MFGRLNFDQIYPPKELETWFKQLVDAFNRGMRRLENIRDDARNIIKNIPDDAMYEDIVFCKRNIVSKVEPIWFFLRTMKKVESDIRRLKTDLSHEKNRKYGGYSISEYIRGLMLKDDYIEFPEPECTDYVDAKMYEHIADEYSAIMKDFFMASEIARKIADYKPIKPFQPRRLIRGR